LKVRVVRWRVFKGWELVRGGTRLCARMKDRDTKVEETGRGERGGGCESGMGRVDVQEKEIARRRETGP
jgi:hypothetical protein